MPAYDASVPKTRSSSVGWPQRLVDLEVELRRVEDDREPAGRALRRRQERDRLLGERLGAAREVEPADVLVAGRPASRRRRPASSRRWCSSPSTAFASTAAPTWVMICSVNEPSVAANVFHSRCARVQGLGEGDALDRRCRLVRGHQVADLALERDRERVLDDRRLVACRGPAVDRRGRPGRAGRWRTPGRCGPPRAATRSTLGRVEAVRAAKPQAPSTRTRTPKPSLSPEATPSTRPDLTEIDLVQPPDDADVGVAGAPRGRGVEGAVGQLSHRPERSRAPLPRPARRGVGGSSGPTDRTAGPLHSRPWMPTAPARLVRHGRGRRRLGQDPPGCPAGDRATARLASRPDSCREPGGTWAGERIREIVLGAASTNERIAPRRADALLFSAAERSWWPRS